MGAGYIAVEMAGILNGLGAETFLAIRHEEVSISCNMLVGVAIEQLYDCFCKLVYSTLLDGGLTADIVPAGV